MNSVMFLQKCVSLMFYLIIKYSYSVSDKRYPVRVLKYVGSSRERENRVKLDSASAIYLFAVSCKNPVPVTIL